MNRSPYSGVFNNDHHRGRKQLTLEPVLPPFKTVTRRSSGESRPTSSSGSHRMVGGEGVGLGGSLGEFDLVTKINDVEERRQVVEAVVPALDDAQEHVDLHPKTKPLGCRRSRYTEPSVSCIAQDCEGAKSVAGLPLVLLRHFSCIHCQRNITYAFVSPVVS